MGEQSKFFWAGFRRGFSMPWTLLTDMLMAPGCEHVRAEVVVECDDGAKFCQCYRCGTVFARWPWSAR